MGIPLSLLQALWRQPRQQESGSGRITQSKHPDPNLIAHPLLNPRIPRQFQALLTLFPKSFSVFPHGTCSLSNLSMHRALGEEYHHFGAPIPKSTTHTTHPGNGERRVPVGALALIGIPFQNVRTDTRHWSTSHLHPKTFDLG